MQWLTFTSGVTGNDHLFGEGDFWALKGYGYLSRPSCIGMKFVQIEHARGAEV